MGITCAALYKDMKYSSAAHATVSYKLDEEGAEKEVYCKCTQNYVLAAIKKCGYSVTDYGWGLQPLEVYVAYGAWNPTSTPGTYKIQRREDFGKYDEAAAYRE